MLHDVQRLAVVCLAMLLMAGCITPPQDNPQESADANYLAEAYGIFQASEALPEERLGNLYVDGGILAWAEGGLDQPYVMRAHDSNSQKEFTYELASNLTTAHFSIDDGTFLTSVFPVRDGELDLVNRTFIQADIENAEKQQTMVQLQGEEIPLFMDKDWVLFKAKTGEQYTDLIASNWTFSDFQTVFSAEETRLTYRSYDLHEGWVYYSTTAGWENEPPRFFEHDLKNQETREISVGIDGYAIIRALTDDFLFLESGDSWVRHLFAYDRRTGETTQLSSGNLRISNIEASGSWVIFKETAMEPVFIPEDADEPAYYNEGQVQYTGIHMQDAGSKHSLFPSHITDDIELNINPGRESWATDGEIVAFIAKTRADSPNIESPSTQIYWATLP